MATLEKIHPQDQNGTVKPQPMARASTEMKVAAPTLAINFDADEIVILKRYHEMVTTLIARIPKLTLEQGGSLTYRARDFSVTFAVAGNEYFDEFQNLLNYAILHTALILTISLPSFFDPPEFSSSDMKDVFLFMAAISAICHIFSILFVTIFSTALMRPYRAADTMIARIKYSYLFAWALVLDYIGIVLLTVCIVVVSFEYSTTLGYVTFIIIPAICLIIWEWIKTQKDSSLTQKLNTANFQKTYCDEQGFLTDEWLHTIMAGAGVDESSGVENGEQTAVDEFLTNAGFGCYAALFRAHSISYDNLPGLTNDMLREIGVSKVGHRINIIDAAASLQPCTFERKKAFIN